MTSIPHSVESEREVLGSIINRPEALQEFITLGGSTGHFWDLRNKAIFAALQFLCDSGKPIEVVSLYEELKSKGLIEKCGGLPYLSEVAGCGGGPVDYYFTVLDRLLMSRKILDASGKLARLAGESQGESGELSSKAEEIVFALRSGASRTESSRKDSFARLIEAIEEAHTTGRRPGLSTGLRDIDRILCGLKPGTLNILAARPGVGKSSLAMQIAEHNAVSSGLAVGVTSLEMSQDELNLRSACSLAGIDSQRAMDGSLGMGDMEKLAAATARLAKAPIFVLDNPDMDVAQIRAEARRMVSRYDVKLWVIDYLQLVQSGNPGSARWEAVGEISRQLKCMAKELAIPVLALSQLNRASEMDGGRRPRLSDLRESGSIEQDADTVSFLWTPGEPFADSSGLIKTRFTVAKNRSGPVGEREILFRPAQTRFVQLSLMPTPETGRQGQGGQEQRSMQGQSQSTPSLL